MAIDLSIYLSICLSVCLSIYLSVYLSIYISIFTLYLRCSHRMLQELARNKDMEQDVEAQRCEIEELGRRLAYQTENCQWYINEYNRLSGYVRRNILMCSHSYPCSHSHSCDIGCECEHGPCLVLATSLATSCSHSHPCLVLARVVMKCLFLSQSFQIRMLHAAGHVRMTSLQATPHASHSTLEGPKPHCRIPVA